MALKPDRIEESTDISFFMNTVGDRGGIVVHTSGAGGSGMDDSYSIVAYPTTTQSGTFPAGVLLNDVVSLDLTRQHINWHKDEVQVGGKVAILRRGTVVTNRVTGAPYQGQAAYYGVSGILTTTSTNSVKVGSFLSSVDTDGYVRVGINIQ